MAEAYRRKAEQLRAAMDEVDGEDARNAVRCLIDQGVFIPVVRSASSSWRFTVILRGCCGSPARAALRPRRTKPPRPGAAGVLRVLTGVR